MHQSDFRYRVAMFSTIIYLAAFMAIVAPAPNAFGQSDPIPKEIVDLKMGDTSAAV
ncbi:MAG: hypothetical protein HY912_17695, partial [Desulfomonile tiedjei]|nr:hypothetical protein [Desulfomonile tiedjei]